VLALDETILALVQDLPDEKGARLFLDRLAKEHPRAFRKLTSEPGLMSDALALAAWSPLLATTLEQSPEYLSWLNRERLNSRVRTPDELKESLARFALMHSSLNPQILLARFRRRELLRIYLHDVRRTHTLVETTEELSNLADAILDYALSLARQDLDNKHGSPQHTDGRGRQAAAEFCIMALGKLGSHELNYSSDIDLVFLYSDEGETSGAGVRGEVTNRQYFIKLSESVARLVGQQVGEGAAYRVDLRLRPHGRDGALASSLNEAARYYRETAQAWELQALIRARAAAGSSELYSRFANSVRRHVFRAEVPVSGALESVRLAKKKIDRHLEQQARGFNVKLGRGGIREIEFIAQALQIAHGGRDRWLRAPHTLIILGRLADRDLITEQERTELSDAYVFLRMVEHRLQMEHGLQIHVVPQDAKQRALVARRMNFASLDALEAFDHALKVHAAKVRAAYERVFGTGETEKVIDGRTIEDVLPGVGDRARMRAPVDADTAAAYAAATIFAPHVTRKGLEGSRRDIQSVAKLLQNASLESPNQHRALMFTARVASSLDKLPSAIELSEENLVSLVRLCGASEFFGEMVAGNPILIRSLEIKGKASSRRDYLAVLRAGIGEEKNFAAELSAFRRAWSRLLLEVGTRDVAGTVSAFESNQLQTELAIASINVACLIARRELVRRFGTLADEPQIAILGLGRLGSGGVDYGSDLDIIIIYDSSVPSPITSLTPDEAYARLGELMIASLSSVTREGYLYRVDLRLRPHGNNGPLVSASQSFVDYLKQRAAVWEWLAYVKVRAVAGDLELGRTIESQARQAIHEAAQQINRQELTMETRHVRSRLEKEKAKAGRRAGIDIKYGAGGMLDVYFAVRYLQLRDDLRDEGEDRSTLSTLARLRAAGSLSVKDHAALSNGYSLLRAVDHHLRLLVGRSARLPAPDHLALRDIARNLGYSSATALTEALSERMASIRVAYDRITRV
jgi:glutamate-ammonia-ligase adenylyltransferase